MTFRRICIAGASGSDNGFSTGSFVARAILEKKKQGKVDDVLIIGRKGSVEKVDQRAVEGDGARRASS